MENLKSKNAVKIGAILSYSIKKHHVRKLNRSQYTLHPFRIAAKRSRVVYFDR